MTNKKESPQVVNNIQELNLEIDYDKLAEAIIKAERKQEELPPEELDDESEDIGFWKSVWFVIRNKEEPSGTLFAEALVTLMTLFFNALAVFCFAAGIFAIIEFVCNIYDAFHGIEKNLWKAFAPILQSSILLILALPLRGIANEISREKSKKYIYSTFSSVMSLVAVIIALVN